VALSEFTLAASDGYPLGATLFGAPSKRAVLVMAASGVPQAYYAKFATHLAERGFRVLTFDYRGIGRSRSTSVRKLPARMRDWALLDGAAALAALDDAEQVLVVGHSFGGQSLGLLPNPERIRAALVVGSQSGYWRHWSALGRAWMWPSTHLLLPGISHLLGYFPGSRLGFGEDLPPGVAIEWASWCRHPTYLVGSLGVEEAYARFRAPIRAYALSDDAFAPPGAVRALLELYPAAKGEMREVTPAEVGAKRIGHFGFFRERFRDTLWRDACDWLKRQ
jgi:predicted alpha/beta hydrolase